MKKYNMKNLEIEINLKERKKIVVHDKYRNIPIHYETNEEKAVREAREIEEIHKTSRRYFGS